MQCITIETRCVQWTRFAVHFMGCHHFLEEISFGTSVNLKFNHKFISIVVLWPVNRNRCASSCIVRWTLQFLGVSGECIKFHIYRPEIEFCITDLTLNFTIKQTFFHLREVFILNKFKRFHSFSCHWKSIKLITFCHRDNDNFPSFIEYIAKYWQNLRSNCDFVWKYYESLFMLFARNLCWIHFSWHFS